MSSPVSLSMCLTAHVFLSWCLKLHCPQYPTAAGVMPCNWQCHHGQPLSPYYGFIIHYKPVEESQWLEQGAKFSSWNVEHVLRGVFFFLLHRFVCLFLFRKLRDTSWKMKHAKRTCFRHSFTIHVLFFCEWVERQINLILSVFNHFMCGWLCDVHLK